MFFLSFIFSIQLIYGQEENDTTLEFKSYESVVPKDGIVVSVLIKESNFDNNLLDFLKSMRAQQITNNLKENEITALVHPIVVKLLEERNDVSFVTILGTNSNSCRSNHILIYKVTDDSIACVYESTFPVLVHRG